MALFQPPAPPEGYEYVVRDQKYVLVPKSELGEDICAATGRTWAEEARLYNIRNAPDGKKIAEPGDPFYQTAESMKNKNKQINGAVSAGSLKFFNMLSGSNVDNSPSLSVTMDKVKDGSIFSDITANLNKIGEVSGNLPGVSNAQLEAAKADIAQRMEQAKADLPKLLAMTQSRLDVLTKRKIAETGKPPTEAEIKAASGALTIFQDGPRLLEQKAADISKEIAVAGKDFGFNLNKGLNTAADFTKAGVTKMVNIAKAAGTKITEFANGVPSQTIPNPVPGGDPIPNPAYATFAANPDNAAKIAKVAEVTGKMNSAAGDLTSKFTELEQKQATGMSDTISELKAFAFAAKLAQPETGVQASVKEFTIDPAGFSPGKINQVIARASKLGPSIDTSLYKDTKDEDLTYTGDDGIVWDRVNTERQRRNLPGLAAIGSPRPAEPPLVPAGTTPPKDPEASPKIPKIAEPESNTASKKTTTKKKAVFDKDLDEPIYNPFVRQYAKIYDIWLNAFEALNKQVQASSTTIWIGDAAPDWPRIRDATKKILEEKPDASTRTDEEKLIVKQRNFYRELSLQYSELFRRADWTLSRVKEIYVQYGVLREAFLAGKTFGDLPREVETAIMKDSGPVDWKKFVTDTYTSYAEFAKANPDKAKPPTS